MRTSSTLYEINTVLWLGELSAKYSKRITLGNVPAREWDKIKRYKFDYVWLMGVWRRSPEGRKIAQLANEMYQAYNAALPGWTDKDIAGSPYSIQGYEPDAVAGTWEDLAKAREQLSRRGSGLILDLIPNHTGIDCPWVRRSPNVYLQGSPGNFQAHADWFFPVTRKGQTTFIGKGRDPYFPPWNDTLQVNYFHAAARSAFKRLVKKLAGYCDGLRCDMAMLGLNEVFSRTWAGVLEPADPPTEFWEEVIGSSPRLLWIAEAYWNTEWRLQQLGFDAVYDKRFYDRVRSHPAPDLLAHLKAAPGFQQKLVRFLENHDEPRSANVFSAERLRAAVVLLCSVPGIKLFHQGQFEGKRLRIPVQLARATEEGADVELQDYYRKTLALFQGQVIKKGDWRLLHVGPTGDSTGHNLIACSFEMGSDLRVVVVNLSADWAQGRISFRPPGASGAYTLLDQMTGARYVRDRAETESIGLHVLLAPYQTHVFQVKPKG